MADKVSWLPPFESSNLAHVGYNHDTKRLVALFRNGNPYLYHDVPEDVFTALVDTIEIGASVGKAFNELVKGGGFKFEQLTPAGDPVPEKPERTIRGAPVGMLWYDNSQTAFNGRCERALEYYIEKYGSSPNQDYIIFVHPDTIPADIRSDDGIIDFAQPTRLRYLVQEDTTILPNHFLVSEVRV